MSLAFDDKVVLRDVSFTLLPGHTKLILGASGSGKSTILKLILGLLQARRRRGAGSTASAWTRWPSASCCGCAADFGMVFQEGALFDSLTVGENVGFKLYEETDMPLAEVRRARRGSAGVRPPGRLHRPEAVGALGRPAPARGDRPGDGVEAGHPPVR